MRPSFLLLIASVLLLTSCRYFGGERVYGNKNVVTRDIPVDAFTRVHVSGGLDVQVMQAATPGVQVQTDENLLEYLDIYTDGNDLTIKEKQGYNVIPSKDLVIRVSAPDYRELDGSGSVNFTSANTLASSGELKLSISGSGNMNLQVNAPKITSEISGSGSLDLKGSAGDFDASVSGSGSIRSFELATNNARVDLTGSADAKVNASKSLDVEISGSGSVQYRGNPSVKQRVSGSGSIEKVG